MTKYKFRNPQNKDKETVEYHLLEDRGDRALFEPLNYCQSWVVRPTQVFMKADMIEVDE